MNQEGKKPDKQDTKKPKQDESSVEFGSKKDERINSSNFTHSGNQIGGAGGEESERDIIRK